MKSVVEPCVHPILIVDDNPEDAQTLATLLRGSGVANPIQILTNGIEAIAYFRGDAPYHNRAEYPLPKIVFLDLKMPGVDGFDVLRWLSIFYRLEDLLVFVVTGLEDTELIRRSYAIGAKSFVEKPCGVRDIQNLIQSFPAFWMQMPHSGTLGASPDIDSL